MQTIDWINGAIERVLKQLNMPQTSEATNELTESLDRLLRQYERYEDLAHRNRELNVLQCAREWAVPGTASEIQGRCRKLKEAVEALDGEAVQEVQSDA